MSYGGVLLVLSASGFILGVAAWVLEIRRWMKGRAPRRADERTERLGARESIGLFVWNRALTTSLRKRLAGSRFDRWLTRG